ncbi:MAG: response regulator, partial [Massilia sp.]
ANVAERDVEVIFNISPDLPRSLVGDALRLQQVLLNLTGNAIKFTPHGEVVLTVTPLATGAESTRILFSVRDTGIGIAPDQITSIFQGFSQAEASTARRFGGTGLGLAISQRLVMLMGGQLSVFSEPGQGSRFEFTITLGHGEPLPDAPIYQSVQHLQCLVVDDNATCRDVLSAMAGAYGWHADAVASGAEALDSVQQHRYDVVFVDWRMPGMDGWETSKRLRALCNGPGRPLIIMVTAHDAALVADTEGQLGPVLDAMLVKPITASMLFDTVSDLRKGLTAPGPARDLAAMAALAAADAGSLDGVQLLVVDDNAMNLQVARELLGAVGATVTTADAGRAAIDIVCKGEQKFDLILMDIQMPDIDGYAATAAIHASLGAKAPAIIAMTANALATDRESALAAGMVDHVGKPFDLAQLIATILKHYAGMASEAAPTLTLDRTSALTRLGGNEGIYLGVLRGFPAEMAKIRIQVEEIAAGRRTESAAGAMHLLRGLAGMVGAARLAGLARIIEDALLGGASAESLARQLGILIDEIGLASAAAMEASRE